MSIIVGASVAFSVGGALLKPSAGFTRLTPTLAASVCFLIGAGLMARALMSTMMSTAVVLGLGVEAVATVGFGLVVLGERLSVVQASGIALVIFGVALLR
jgi:quaternary ammonium compound-resistance protein SugE